MNSGLLLAGLAIVVVLGAFLWMRRGAGRKNTPPSGHRPHSQTLHAAPHAPPRDGFEALVFVAGNPRCDAAAAMARRTLQKREAPALPLSGCSAPERCQCRLRPVGNRRRGQRRIGADRRGDIRFDDDGGGGDDRRGDAKAWTTPHD